jgi:hypothetical protein
MPPRLFLSTAVALSLATAVLAGGQDASGHPDRGPCPVGWHLKAPAKTQSGGSTFTCIPDKPQQKITCPADTEYFEEDCAFGCEAPAGIPE